ncbi:MAG: hypothetical protein RDV48_06270 [Candidatus Eremiobacteraeota bacterium]|nr:hypothetical protein [Candidatus Eremiobacteraeota bacterium]
MRNVADGCPASDRPEIQGLIENGCYSDAIAIMEGIMASGKLESREFLTLGMLYVKDQRWEKAIAILNEYLLENPGSWQALRQLTIALECGGKAEMQSALYERILENPHLKDREVRLDLLLWLRDHYTGKNDLEALSHVLERLVELEPQKKHLFTLCNLYLAGGRADDEALKVYEKVYNLRQRDRALVRQLAHTYRALGKERWKHLDICLLAYQNDREDDLNTSYLASVFMRKDETIDDAIEEVYKTSLERNLLPRGALLYHLGLFYESRKKSAEAIKAYEESAQEGYGEDSHYPLSRIAFFFKAKRDYTEARRYFILQLRTHKDDRTAISELREMLFIREKGQKLSLEELTMAKEILLYKPAVNEYLTVGNTFLKDYNAPLEALECFNNALVLAPSNRDGLEGSRECLEKLGRYEEALGVLFKLLDQKLKKEEEVALYWDIAAIYHERVNNYAAAVDYYDKILALQPGNYKASKEKLGALWEMGDNARYYLVLRATWERFYYDPDILSKMRTYFERSSMSNAAAIVENISTFLMEDAVTKPFCSDKARALTLELCIHPDESKAREELDLTATKIGKPPVTYELSKEHELLLAACSLPGPEAENIYKSYLDATVNLFGPLNVIFKEYTGIDDFYMKVFQGDDENYAVINRHARGDLSSDMAGCLFAMGLSHCVLNHFHYFQRIEEIDRIINEHIEKLVKFVESKLISFSDFLKAPLIFMIRLLKQKRLRRTILEKILDNIESLRHYPLVYDTVKKVLGLVLAGETSAQEFLRTSRYSSDRAAYAVSGDVLTVTRAAILDEMGITPDAADTGNVKKGALGHRILELWKFAIDLETGTP